MPLRVTAPGLLVPAPVLLSMRRLRAAIDYARENDMDVVSMSLGGVEKNTGLHVAVKAAYEAGVFSRKEPTMD